MVRWSTRFAWAALAVLAGCADTGAVLRSARAQQHAAVVLAYLDVLHNRADAAEARRLYLAPGYVDHAPAVLVPGRVEVLRSVSQADLVAVLMRAPGEGGSTQGLQEIYRLYQGRIVDRWAAQGPDPGTTANASGVAPRPQPVR